MARLSGGYPAGIEEIVLYEYAGAAALVAVVAVAGVAGVAAVLRTLPLHGAIAIAGTAGTCEAGVGATSSVCVLASAPSRNRPTTVGRR